MSEFEEETSGVEMIFKSVSGVVGAALLCSAAQAEVKESAPDALVIQIKAEIPLDRAASWTRLLNVGSWWSDAHTYSGKAASMSIDAVAGGCWCELWAGGEVEHGRVIYLSPQQALRLSSALGPLQEMGVASVMTFTLSDGSAPDRTAVTLDMKVSGSSLSGLDKIGPAVDQVLSEQVMRLAKGE